MVIRTKYIRVIIKDYKCKFVTRYCRSIKNNDDIIIITIIIIIIICVFVLTF
jgi:hypothetical protein